VDDTVVTCATGNADWFAVSSPVLGKSWDVQSGECYPVSAMLVSAVSCQCSQGTGNVQWYTSVSDILTRGQQLLLVFLPIFYCLFADLVPSFIARHYTVRYCCCHHSSVLSCCNVCVQCD